jgi:LysR family transcriptional regulator, transcriptional activator for leuABCD operon
MLNLRSVDLNLLPVFEAAYEERSLSRAAARLAMTQPAVSHAMTRLRALFGDELFVRRSRGVDPTPAADRIYAKLRGALVAVRDAVTEARGFDPATSERRFVVSIPHPLGPMVAVRLRERLARIAPRVKVACSTRSRPIEQARGLREGRLDAAVDWIVPADPRFATELAFEDGVAFMAKRGHPALRLRSLAQVLRSAEFVMLRARAEGEHPVPALRELQRLPMRIALEVSEFVEVLMVAGGSDLLAPVPLSMERLAVATFGLREVKAVPRVAPIPVNVIRDRGRDRDPAHAFLRTELARVVREVARAR